MIEPLIELEQVKTYFPHKKNVLGKTIRWTKAVDNVSLKIAKGENLGLVGESGCGKSTLGRSILRLVPIHSGKVLFENRPIQDLNRKKFAPFRAAMQMVFQQPQSSLNPKMKIIQILEEALRICPDVDKKDYKERAAQLLQLVDLRPEHLFRYPHEYSGGQQQRICIARAMATGPKFIVFDEATSALDVSVQAQILRLMNKLQQQLNLTYLFIAHDLSVLEQVCQRIAVMYAGKIVEIQKAENLFSNPRHPYTKLLRDAIPIADPTQKQKFTSIVGEPPNLSAPPSGCRFHPRCEFADEICRQQEPSPFAFGQDEVVFCHKHKALLDNNTLQQSV